MATAKKAAAKKAPAKKAPAKKSAPAKTAPAKKTAPARAAGTAVATRPTRSSTRTGSAAPARKAVSALVVKEGEGAWTKAEIKEVLSELHSDRDRVPVSRETLLRSRLTPIAKESIVTKRVPQREPEFLIRTCETRGLTH